MKDNSPQKLFTPETLGNASKQVEDLRVDFLFDIDDVGADPLAEQQFIIAIDHLDLAVRYLRMACLIQMGGLR